MAELDELMDTDGLSAYLDIPKRTLEIWRQVGKGPAYRKVGHRVRYAKSDVAAWVDAQRREQTAAG